MGYTLQVLTSYLLTIHFIYLIFQPKGIKLDYEDCKFPLLMFEISRFIHVYLLTSILGMNFNASMSDRVSQNLTCTKDDEKHFLFDFLVI